MCGSNIGWRRTWCAATIALALLPGWRVVAVESPARQSPDLAALVDPIREAIISNDAQRVSELAGNLFPGEKEVSKVFPDKADAMWQELGRNLATNDTAFGRKVLKECRLDASYTLTDMMKLGSFTRTDGRYKYFAQLLKGSQNACIPLFHKPKQYGMARGYELGLFIEVDGKWFWFAGAIDVAYKVYAVELEQIAKQDRQKEHDEALAAIDANILKLGGRSEDQYQARRSLALTGVEGLPKLGEALTSTNMYISHGVISIIAEMAGDIPEAVPYLKKALSHSKPDITRAAISRLGKLPSSQWPGKDDLLRLLSEHTDTDVRAEVMRMIEEKPAAVYPDLIAALGSTDENKQKLRSAALVLVARIKPDEEKLHEAIAGALEDKNGDVFRCAIEAVDICGPKMARLLPGLRKTLVQGSTGRKKYAAMAIGALRASAVEAVPELIAQCRLLPGEEPRAQFMVAFGRIGPGAKESVPLVEEVLNDGSAWNDRFTAAIALVRMVGNHTGAVAFVEQALDTNDMRQRCDVIAAFDLLGQEARPLVPQLKKALRHPEVSIRCVAVRALSRLNLNPSELLPDLLPMMSDKVINVRWDVIDALGALGPAAAEAIPLLEKAVSNSATSTKAKAALEKIRAKNSTTSPGK